MEKPNGITAELYQVIVSIVEDKVRQIRVTREDFNELRGIVKELAQAQVKLASLLHYSDILNQVVERNYLQARALI